MSRTRASGYREGVEVRPSARSKEPVLGRATEVVAGRILPVQHVLVVDDRAKILRTSLTPEVSMEGVEGDVRIGMEQGESRAVGGCK